MKEPQIGLVRLNQALNQLGVASEQASANLQRAIAQLQVAIPPDLLLSPEQADRLAKFRPEAGESERWRTDPLGLMRLFGSLPEWGGFVVEVLEHVRWIRW